MTTKSILKHPYWLPPENENDNPHYEQFCKMAMRAFTRWREDAYALGVISADEYKTYLNGGVEDIPGSSTVKISADHRRIPIEREGMVRENPLESSSHDHPTGGLWLFRVLRVPLRRRIDM